MDSHECLFNMEDSISIELSAQHSIADEENEYDDSSLSNNDEYLSKIKQEIIEIPPVDEDLLKNQKINNDFAVHYDILNQHLEKDDEFQQLLGIKQEKFDDYISKNSENYQNNVEGNYDIAHYEQSK